MKLLLLVIVEIVVALAVAGSVLAVTVPALIGRHAFNPGDLGSSVLIILVLVLAVAAVLSRPGSALRRRNAGEL